MIYDCSKYGPIKKIDCGNGEVYLVGYGDFRPGKIKCCIHILNGKEVAKDVIESDRELILKDEHSPDFRPDGTKECGQKSSFWTHN